MYGAKALPVRQIQISATVFALLDMIGIEFRRRPHRTATGSIDPFALKPGTLVNFGPPALMRLGAVMRVRDLFERPRNAEV